MAGDGSDDGWNIIYNKAGLKMGRKKFNKQSFMKTTMYCDMPFKQGTHMLSKSKSEFFVFEFFVFGQV